MDKTNETEPYAWEASSRQIARQYGLDEERIVRFDMNTAPYVLDAVEKQAKRKANAAWNEYPSPDYGELTEAVAAYAQVECSQVVLGAGADEVIDTVAKTMLSPGSRSVIATPTYSMFRICSQAYGAQAVNVPRGERFALDVEALSRAAQDASAVWVCNPNSPTGNAEPLDRIRELLERAPCIVVVDEAYVEFGGQSASGLLEQFENLVVIRTLSKAFGLAGARVGYALAGEAVARQLNRMRLPNSISRLSAELAQAALSPEGVMQMRRTAAAMAKERRRMEKTLDKRYDVYPSVANFLLVRLGRTAGQTAENLRQQGLVVRDLSDKAGTQDCVRITIRSKAENDRLLEALA